MLNQTYKGHVTIVPTPTVSDYASLLKNITPEVFFPKDQEIYVQALRSKLKL